MQVLLVEDDVLLADGIIKALQAAGFVCNSLDSVTAACHQLVGQPPDILVLDLGLPDHDGLEVLRFMRRQQLKVPVLILSARGELQDKIEGLGEGADDYLTKPFARDELIARLRVFERRLSQQTDLGMQVGAVWLQPQTFEAKLDGQPLNLSRKEFLLLKALMERPGKIQTKQSLENRMYSWDEELASNALEVHIHHLRKKLPDQFIQTVRGIGYRVLAT